MSFTKFSEKIILNKLKNIKDGNLKLVTLPKIETPKGLEMYEPEHKEEITTSLSGLKGKVYDQYAVVPQFRGKFKI